jgi:hypothetical protein
MTRTVSYSINSKMREEGEAVIFFTLCVGVYQKTEKCEGGLVILYVGCLISG